MIAMSLNATTVKLFIGVTLGTFCCLLLFLSTLNTGQVFIVQDEAPQQNNIGGFDVIENGMSLLHRDRILHIKDVCINRSMWNSTVYTGKDSLSYYFTRQYDFGYCKVPKCGCTFWTQLFSLLENGPESYDDTFGMKRASVHSYSSKFSAPFSTVKTHRTVLVSRDPYSRLFSAYVDKIFLPLMYSSNQRIMTYLSQGEELPYCQNNVTFQHFLDFVTGTAYQGQTLNRHWAPIFSLCRPCDVEQFILVKQETFSKDIEYVLEQVGVEQRSRQLIMKALHSHRVEATIPGIVKTIIDSSNKKITACLGWREIARRIWVSFQIQGYICNDLDFPANDFMSDSQFKNSTFLTKIILDTIASNPLASSESKDQRRKALVGAYRQIRWQTIQAIQDVFREDFAIYAYDIYPPK